MSRPTVATITGLLFVTLYIVAAITIRDAVGPMHWAIQLLYWCIAGVIWVFPIWYLMLWSVYKR